MAVIKEEKKKRGWWETATEMHPEFRRIQIM